MIGTAPSIKKKITSKLRELKIDPSVMFISDFEPKLHVKQKANFQANSPNLVDSFGFFKEELSDNNSDSS